MSKIFLLSLCLFTAAAGAQTSASAFVPEYIPDGVLHLDQSWRFHDSDQAAWAQPAFDDSDWPSIALPATIRSGWSWYRLRLDLPRGHAPLGLMLVAPRNACEVYIDGRRVDELSIRGWLSMTASRGTLIPLPERTGPIQLALRVYYPRLLAEGYGAKLDVSLGSPEALRRQADATLNNRFLLFLPSGMINLAIALGGFAVLGLFAAERSRLEYLWVGLFLINMGVSNAVWRAVDTSLLPYWANVLYADPSCFVQMVFQIEFTFAFIHRPVSRAWRICEAILLFHLLLTVAMVAGVLPVAVYFIMENFVLLITAVGLPVLLLVRFRQGNSEAGWLIFPSLLPPATIAVTGIATVAVALESNAMAFLKRPLTIGRLSIFVAEVADLTFLLAIGVVLFLRFTRANYEQARVRGELEAARDIQRQLVPTTLPVVAGCRIEAAYLPAQEVGGDFYQVLEQKDGALIVVVGDVSGKGLKAAMKGALTLGAVRTLAAEGLKPGVLLTRLNEETMRTHDGGFITCLCIRLVRDGMITAANAGHLAPYRNHEEIAIEPGLPLGITPDAEYRETAFMLEPGQTLAFLSDGVVEAQNKEGELFGFDRTRAISGQTAQQIAYAAQRFGQEDDITVLTLNFAPGERAAGESMGLVFGQTQGMGP